MYEYIDQHLIVDHNSLIQQQSGKGCDMCLAYGRKIKLVLRVVGMYQVVCDLVRKGEEPVEKRK